MPDYQGERLVTDPRRAFRERKQALAEGRPLEHGLGQPPPGLLGESLPVRAPVRQLRELADTPDPAREHLVLRVRPGKRRNGKSRVRVYHVLPGAIRSDLDARCWAFTITRLAYERLVTERVLDSEGATFPDGRLCVPPEADPMDVPVSCGTCGTTSVECLQMELWED